MRIIFMGSAEISCVCLEALFSRDNDEVIAVVTQPDRPQGRGRRVAPCIVKQRIAKDITVLTPDNVNSSDSVKSIRALEPDLIVVVAYGQILKAELLGVPPFGCINVHASLLPKYRGTAPIQWAIANGETMTGVTTMFMDEGLDTGDIFLQKKVPITADDTGGTLHDKLGLAGANLLIETINRIGTGDILRVPQDNRDATCIPKLKKSDGRIDWTARSQDIRNRVRAFNPWLCCFSEIPDKPGHHLKILAVSMDDCSEGEPGTVLEWEGDGPLVKTGDGAVRLTEVQPEGKKPMSGSAYMRGHPCVARLF